MTCKGTLCLSAQVLCSPRKAGGPESPPALASSREEEKFPCEYDVGARGSSAVKAHSRLLCPFLLWLRRDSYYSGSESSLTPLGALLHGPSAAKGQSEQPKGLRRPAWGSLSPGAGTGSPGLPQSSCGCRGRSRDRAQAGNRDGHW